MPHLKSSWLVPNLVRLTLIEKCQRGKTTLMLGVTPSFNVCVASTIGKEVLEGRSPPEPSLTCPGGFQGDLGVTAMVLMPLYLSPHLHPCLVTMAALLQVSSDWHEKWRNPCRHNAFMIWWTLSAGKAHRSDDRSRGSAQGPDDLECVRIPGVRLSYNDKAIGKVKPFKICNFRGTTSQKVTCLHCNLRWCATELLYTMRAN